MPLVSIIVPIYNVEKYLPDCLNSLINQTLFDIEAICINDCSTDNSFSICKKFADKDNRIKVISLTQNSGPGIARNKGLEMAKGDYIMFLDPDDWLEPHACEVAYKQILKNKNDFVYFNLYCQREEQAEKNIDTYRLAPFKHYFNGHSFKLSDINPSFIQTSEAWYKIYSRNFLIKNHIRFSSEYLCEDIPFYIHAIIASNSVSVLNMPIYNYRIRKDSASSSGNRHWKDIFTAREKAYKLILSSKDKNIYLQSYLPYYIDRTLFWFYRFTNQNKKIKKDFYNKMRVLFISIDRAHNIGYYTNKKEIKKIIHYNWYIKNFFTFLEKFFSVKNSKNKKHKIITFLGIKFKIRRFSIY